MGEEAAGLIDDEEAPVADEAEGVEVGGEDGNAGERFNGVKEDAHCFAKCSSKASTKSKSLFAEA